MKPKEVLKKALDGVVLSKDEIKIIASNAQCSKIYAQKVREGRFLEGEEIIKTNVAQSYLYAKDVINGRWIEGEDIISKDSFYSLNYAQNVLASRFAKGENAISSNGNHSIAYAQKVLKKRFEKGEKEILNSCDGEKLADYAINTIKDRWPEAEDKILNSDGACDYACFFEFRWPEAEPTIIKNPNHSVSYARRIIKGRWPEAEEQIAKSPHHAVAYAKFIEERFELAESTIIENMNHWVVRDYHNNVLKGKRWEKLENFIENFSGKNEKLIELIQMYSDCCTENLPDFMHNRMIAIAITDQDNWTVKQYFSSFEERQNAEKLSIVERFSVERLREIVSSIDE